MPGRYQYSILCCCVASIADIKQTVTKHATRPKTITYSRKAERAKEREECVYRTRALVKSQRKALTPEWEKIRKDTNVQGKGFGKIRKESTYARAGNARKKE